MADNVTFSSEIKSLKSELTKSEKQLAALQDKQNTYESDIQQLRDSLDALRSALAGNVPASKAKRGVKPVPRRKGSERPKRGSRKDQIISICRVLGRGGESFQTKMILAELKRVEGEISSGIRSYTYALMNTLQEEGLVEKVGRGTWKWTG